MIRKTKTTLDDIKSSTIETIRNIMHDLAEQKSNLDSREKDLRNLEKDLLVREKGIEQEVESFGRDILSLIGPKENPFFAKAKRISRK